MEINNPRGILLMALGFALFAVADTIAKVLLEYYPPLQVVFLRQLGLFFGVNFIMLYNLKWFGKTQNFSKQLLRGFTQAGSAVIFLVGLKTIPIADATSIAFVAPLFVIILSYFILKEPIGIRRWLAVVIGFSGTLIIIRPGFEIINLGHLFIIIAALLFALRQIISRLLAPTDNPLTTAFFTAYTSVFIFVLFQPWVWTPITDKNHILLFLVYAVFAGTAEFLVIKSLQIAHAVVVSPLQYTLLIWVTIFGFIIWGILPDFWTFLGAGVIIATGLYSLHRERVRKSS
jgi:S-adenosylmethionine uptake transporter|tara:strand:+ start:347 stop:1210 length:864 start_codon:yes stop_codon:yes gene_type:complete